MQHYNSDCLSSSGVNAMRNQAKTLALFLKLCNSTSQRKNCAKVSSQSDKWRSTLVVITCYSHNHNKLLLLLQLLLLQTFYDPLSGTTQVSRYQKDKPFWILLKQTWWGGSGIRWTICKLFALRSRQITTPAPHQSDFYRPNALPDTQPTASKHWRQDNHDQITSYSYTNKS